MKDRSQRIMPSRRIGPCVFVAFASVSAACVRDERKEPSEPAPEEVGWNFSSARSEPKLRLWPSSPSAPGRLKRSMQTENDHGRLAAKVDGKDPYFVWRFDGAVSAGLVSIDVEASEAGPIQLYWSSAACPTFRESCSLIERASEGRQWIDFLIERNTTIRELRLDLPDKAGITLWFYAILVLEKAELSPRWAARSGAISLSMDPSGLRVVALEKDPWITVTTPGLVASRFDTVDLVLHGTTPVAPQLFWDGPCGHFDEACSVHLRAADSGAVTHRADLSKVPTWRGPIHVLRLDPSQDEGEYTIDRILLSRRPKIERTR